MRLSNIVKFATSAQHRKAALTKRLFWALRKLGIDEISVRRKAGVFHVSTSDMEIALYTVAHGGYDPTTFFAAIDIVRERCALKGLRFLDIGANIGHITVFAMSTGLFRSALCIEPDPENFRRLLHTIRRNDYADVRCVNVGLSDESGELQLYRNPSNLGDYRPAEKDRHVDRNWDSVRVPVDTLDRILAGERLVADEIGFICLDVQGWEGHVLAGASSVLARGVPLLIEIWPSALKANGSYEQVMKALREVYSQFFARRGKALVQVELAELRRLADESKDADFQFDLLCIQATPLNRAQ